MAGEGIRGIVLGVGVNYRIVSEPSWRVESFHKGEWTVAFYCSSQASAERCLAKCLARQKEWQSLSEAERTRRILR